VEVVAAGDPEALVAVGERDPLTGASVPAAFVPGDQLVAESDDVELHRCRTHRGGDAFPLRQDPPLDAGRLQVGVDCEHPEQAAAVLVG